MSRHSSIQRIKIRGSSSVRLGGSVQGLSPTRLDRAHFRQTEDDTQRCSAWFQQTDQITTGRTDGREQIQTPTICWDSRPSLPMENAAASNLNRSSKRR